MQFSKVVIAAAMVAAASLVQDANAHLGNVHCTGGRNVSVQSWANSQSVRDGCNLDRNNEQYCIVIQAAGLRERDFSDCSSCSSNACQSVEDTLERLANGDESEDESEHESDDDDDCVETRSGREFIGDRVGTSTRTTDVARCARRCRDNSRCTHYNLGNGRCYMKRASSNVQNSRGGFRGFTRSCN